MTTNTVFALVLFLNSHFFFFSKFKKSRTANMFETAVLDITITENSSMTDLGMKLVGFN
jgi:hypothetical protein